MNQEQSSGLTKLINIYTDFTLVYKYSTSIYKNANELYYKLKGIPNTLIIIKTANSNILGAFSSQDWSKLYNYVYDNKSFLFSLVNNYNYSTVMNVIKPENAILLSFDSLSFGNGIDLSIRFDENQLIGSSNLGNGYQLPLDLTYSSQSFLAGSAHFIIDEMEIFSVNRK